MESISPRMSAQNRESLLSVRFTHVFTMHIDTPWVTNASSFKWMVPHELAALIQFESRQSLSGRFLTSQRGTKGGMAHCQLIYLDNLITLSDDTLTTPLL